MIDCQPQIDAFVTGSSLGFQTAIFIAGIAFVFGYVLPRFLSRLDRHRKPMTVEQLQQFQQRFNARMSKRIQKAQQRAVNHG